jgi:hypothetical protein
LLAPCFGTAFAASNGTHASVRACRGSVALWFVPCCSPDVAQVPSSCSGVFLFLKGHFFERSAIINNPFLDLQKMGQNIPTQAVFSSPEKYIM